MTRLSSLFLIALLFWSIPLSGSSTTLSESDIRLYKKCFAAAEKNDWQYARNGCNQAHNKLPLKILQWMDLTRPGPGRPFAEYRRFIAENPNWPKQDILWAQAERALSSDIPAVEIIAWFGPREPLTAQGGAVLALALRDLGKDAVPVVRKIWVGRDFDKKLMGSFLANWGKFLRPEDHAARMERLLWDEETEEASQMLPLLSNKNIQQIATARIAFQRAQPNASALYTSLSAEQRKSPGLRLDAAEYYRRKDQPEKAADLLDPPPAAPLNPTRLWGELDRAVRLALEQKNDKRAYRLAKSHGAKDGLVLAEGEFLAGWIALRRLNDAKSAFGHFERLYKGTNSALSRSRGAYWAFLAAKKMGDKELATYYRNIAAQYPLTYYGQLAALSIPNPKPFAFPKSLGPDAAYLRAAANNELVQAVQILGKLGFEKSAKPFLQELASKATKPGEVIFLSQIARDAGSITSALYTAKEARKTGIDVADPLFPVISLPGAKSLRIEPALILGVVKQESAFDLKAQSNAGALGYMQLLPSTAKGVAKKLKIGFAPDQLTRDGQFNIRLGQEYLGSLVDGFDGSYVLAIAAYNAGPGRVRQWIQKYGDPHRNGTDVVDWIEMIPFAETRNYVQRVLENTQIYRARLNSKNVAILALTKDLRYQEIMNAAQ